METSESIPLFQIGFSSASMIRPMTIFVELYTHTWPTCPITHTSLTHEPLFFGNAMFPKRVATACGAYCLRRVLRLTALRGRRERPYCRIVLRPMRLDSYPLGKHSVSKKNYLGKVNSKTVLMIFVIFTGH